MKDMTGKTLYEGDTVVWSVGNDPVIGTVESLDPPYWVRLCPTDEMRKKRIGGARRTSQRANHVIKIVNENAERDDFIIENLVRACGPSGDDVLVAIEQRWEKMNNE